jgi:hypothetical protein
VARDYERCYVQHTRPVGMQGGHVGCKGIFGWFTGRPPQVGESDHAVTGPDQCRNILWGMSRGFNQADRRRGIEAFGGSAVPDIVLVTTPYGSKPRASGMTRLSRPTAFNRSSKILTEPLWSRSMTRPDFGHW